MPVLTFPASGGIDLQGDPTQRDPGTLRDCLNFEQNQQFGYTQCAGWARYDGSTTCEELLDFYFVGDGVPISGSPIFGEQITVSVTQFGGLAATFNAILIGASGAFGRLCFAYANTSSSSFVAIESSTLVSITGALSGFTVGAGAMVYQTGVFNANAVGQASYATLLLLAQLAHKNSVAVVPGNLNSPVDASFVLSDVTYAVRDCTVLYFSAGKQSGAGVIPLEGHVLKIPSQSNLNAGKILQVALNSGNWGTSDAAGYFVVYDEAKTLTGVSGTPAFDLYTSDGVTVVSAAFCTWQAAASWPILPNYSRSVLYKTQDQTAGNTVAWPGWTRVALTREIAYTQAYTGQPTGIGFGPSGVAPFSIYEYSRQGLTSTLAQMSPLTSNTPGCSTATGVGGSWTNINNIKVNDGSFAVSPAIAASSKYIGVNAKGFAFTDANGQALPPNTPILGITVTVQVKTSVAATNQDFSVQLIRAGGTLVPANHGKPNSFPLTTTSTLYSYGGPADLWGSSWTLADVLNANFGALVIYQNINATGGSTISVDFVGITLTYAPPTRLVYIRNALAASPADIPAMIVHYTTDNNSTFTNSNATGTLTIYSTGTEASFTNAGKSRVIGVGEQIRDAPAGAGNLLGWTAGTDYPITYPSSGALDAQPARWEWITYNFYSDPTSQMAFGFNGVEYGSGFDGTYVVRIRTGRRVDLDNPRHGFGYYGFLHIGYASGDVLTSAAGPRPVTVSAAALSQAYNVGQPVVGFANLQGQTLAVFCPRKVAGLQGTSPLNYTQTTLSPALGAFEYTVADVEGSAVWTSFRGVETLRTTNAYGNFETLPLSVKALPKLQPRLQGDSRYAIFNQSPSYAIGVRNKRQYRLFFKDGYTLSLTLFGLNSTPSVTFGYNYTAQGYPAVARHAFQGVRSDGKEVLYACWDYLNATYRPAFTPAPTPAYPYLARLEQGYQNDGQPPLCGLEFNAVYPYTQNQDLTPVTECQFQYVSMYASNLVPFPSSFTGVMLYAQSDDAPMFRSNPQPYSQGTGSGYPYDNYLTFPGSGAGQLQPISNAYGGSPFAPYYAWPFMPAPLSLNSAQIAVSGNRVRIMMDASNALTTTVYIYGLTVAKLVVTYEVNGEARA
jgi:hypothetical protein